MPTKSEDKSFKQVMADIVALDDASKRKVLAYLKRHISSDGLTVDGFIKDLRDKRFRKGFACPHCNSDKIVRNGTHRGRQDYKCKACAKHFSDQTHSPFRGTHYPDKWLPFMEHMVNGLSIRKSAKILGIADSTVFTWRHKMLTALKRMEPDNFEGLLEVDETYFLFSEKGCKKIVGRKPRKRGGTSKFRGISREQACVVVARDRTKQTLAKVACMGQVSKVKANILLKPYVAAVSAVCSDANSTWRCFAGDRGINHVELNASKKQRVIKRIYHIQNVNAFHSRLKKWMDRFKGVATKYLDNYLTWFHFIDAHSREAMSSKKLELLITACLPISPERYTEIRSTKLILP
jgi:transposase-like protein